MTPLRLVPLVALLLGLCAVAVACGSAEKSQAELRAEVEAHLREYLPALGEAYATGDVSVLEGLAAEKEIAAVEKRIDDLMAQGRRLEPTFRELTLEEVNDWNWANAFVTTVETWDLRVHATGTDRVLSEELASRQRVQYQLKREDGEWRVLYRTIES